MAQVQMLVHTNYGRFLTPGEIVEVNDDVAARWERNRIAQIVSDDPVAEPSPDGEIEDDQLDAEYTVADLREIAEANGIDIAGLRKKAEIAAAIKAAGLPL